MSRVITTMFEKITLRIFLICLVSCASMVLPAIWTGDDNALPEVYFKITATFFIVGFANFLFWLVSFFYSLRNIIRAITTSK